MALLDEASNARPRAIKAQAYLEDQAMGASWNGPTIDLRPTRRKRVSFTISWTAVASTDGDLFIEVSDDPRAMSDPANATWIPRTIPSGSYDSVGGNITVSDETITIDANAEDMNLALIDCPAFIRLCYTRRGGGDDDQLQCWVSAD